MSGQEIGHIGYSPDYKSQKLVVPVDEIPKPGSEYHTGYVVGLADGMKKGWKEGIDAMEDAIHGFCAAGIAKKEAERLRGQGND